MGTFKIKTLGPALFKTAGELAYGCLPQTVSTHGERRFSGSLLLFSSEAAFALEGGAVDRAWLSANAFSPNVLNFPELTDAIYKHPLNVERFCEGVGNIGNCLPTRRRDVAEAAGSSVSWFHEEEPKLRLLKKFLAGNEELAASIAANGWDS